MRGRTPLVQPLTRSEAVTLRRVALGIAQASELSPGDLSSLKKLGLVEIDGASLRLTALGRQHYSALPRRVPITDSASHVDYVQVLAQHIRGPVGGDSPARDLRPGSKAVSTPRKIVSGDQFP